MRGRSAGIALRAVLFVGIALTTCAGVLLWLGDGDVDRALIPVRAAARVVLGG